MRTLSDLDLLGPAFQAQKSSDSAKDEFKKKIVHMKHEPNRKPTIFGAALNTCVLQVRQQPRVKFFDEG